MLQDLSIKRHKYRIFKWNGVEDCPDCNKPSCTCLHDLTSLEKLYSYGTYKDINVTDKLPMCDKQSRMIDGKGKSWCYVHRHSDCCGDNQQSSKYPNVDYSYQACQKPKTQGSLHYNGLYLLSNPSHTSTQLNSIHGNLG